MRILYATTASVTIPSAATPSAAATPEAADGDRATLESLGAAYAAAGHQLVVVRPGERDRLENVGCTRLVTVASPRLPGWRAQRYLLDRPAFCEVLARVRPDAVEIADRRLRWLGREARRRGIPALVAGPPGSGHLQAGAGTQLAPPLPTPEPAPPAQATASGTDGAVLTLPAPGRRTLDLRTPALHGSLR